MAKPCSICIHPRRMEIEKELLSTTVGYRKVARSFDVSAPALFRHRKNHLPKLLARALAVKPKPVAPRDPAPIEHAVAMAEYQSQVQEEERRHAIDVTQQLRAINAACLEVLRTARAENQPSMLLRAVDRITRQIELQAKLLGEIQEAQTVNIAVLPEWHGLRQVILEALAPFPEARAAVADAIRRQGPAGGGL